MHIIENGDRKQAPRKTFHLKTGERQKSTRANNHFPVRSLSAASGSDQRDPSGSRRPRKDTMNRKLHDFELNHTERLKAALSRLLEIVEDLEPFAPRDLSDPLRVRVALAKAILKRAS